MNPELLPEIIALARTHDDGWLFITSTTVHYIGPDVIDADTVAEMDEFTTIVVPLGES